MQAIQSIINMLNREQNRSLCVHYLVLYFQEQTKTLPPPSPIKHYITLFDFPRKDSHKYSDHEGMLKRPKFRKFVVVLHKDMDF